MTGTGAWNKDNLDGYQAELIQAMVDVLGITDIGLVTVTNTEENGLVKITWNIEGDYR